MFSHAPSALKIQLSAQLASVDTPSMDKSVSLRLRAILITRVLLAPMDIYWGQGFALHVMWAPTA